MNPAFGPARRTVRSLRVRLTSTGRLRLRADLVFAFIRSVILILSSSCESHRGSSPQSAPATCGCRHAGGDIVVTRCSNFESLAGLENTAVKRGAGGPFGPAYAGYGLEMRPTGPALASGEVVSTRSRLQRAWRTCAGSNHPGRDSKRGRTSRCRLARVQPARESLHSMGSRSRRHMMSCRRGARPVLCSSHAAPAL
jgi:hypothetical protein